MSKAKLICCFVVLMMVGAAGDCWGEEAASAQARDMMKHLDDASKIVRSGQTSGKFRNGDLLDVDQRQLLVLTYIMMKIGEIELRLESLSFPQTAFPGKQPGHSTISPNNQERKIRDIEYELEQLKRDISVIKIEMNVHGIPIY